MKTIKLNSDKVGIFSDIHIGVSQDSSLRLEIAMEFAKWSSDHFKKNGIENIVIPGDIFHNRSEISVKTLHFAKKFFDCFKDFNVFISTGNHDVYLKNSSEIHSIAFLSEWENVTIIDNSPVILTFPCKKIASMIPWGTELENFPISDIMFAHLDIQTFYMNNYSVCEHGFKSSDLFDKSKFIISGHFHKRDYREYKEGKILYVGSPYQMNFGEVGNDRGIYIFDASSETFEFIENDISPKHIKILLSDIQSKKEILDDVKGNIVLFTVDKNLSPDKQSVILSKLESLSPAFLKVEYKLEQISGIEDTDGIKLSDIPSTICEYVESMEFEHKKDLSEYLISVYDKVS